LSSISFTITPASLCENNEKVKPYLVEQSPVFDAHIVPMSTNDRPISTCTCSKECFDSAPFHDLTSFMKSGNFRKFSLSKPTMDSKPMTVAIYSSSCPASTCLGLWENSQSVFAPIDNSNSAIVADLDSFENFLENDVKLAKRKSSSLAEPSCMCDKERRLSTVLDPSVKQYSMLSSTVFYKVANFMRIQESFENKILNFSTKTTNKRTMSPFNGPSFEHPMKSQSKFVTIHNPDTSSSSQTSHFDKNSSVRRQRHSIGQMSYFKMLGLGGLGKKMAASTSSLFSTAVISGSGSSSAPNLRDMITNTTAQTGELNCLIFFCFKFVVKCDWLISMHYFRFIIIACSHIFPFLNVLLNEVRI
jgi:hypothetical protein